MKFDSKTPCKEKDKAFFKERSKKDLNLTYVVVKLAKHSDFSDLSYERSGKRLKQRNITRLLMLHTRSLNFVAKSSMLKPCAMRHFVFYQDEALLERFNTNQTHGRS